MKILVIDDDPKIVQVLQIRLKFAGYEVLTSVDGVQGLLLAKEFKPDLVILDIMMPVGGGFSVAYRLREQYPGLPFIFITASRQQGLRQMADSLGAAGFIEKPYEKDELMAVVAKALAAAPSPVARPPQPPKTEFPSSAPPSSAPPAPEPHQVAPSAPTTPDKTIELRLANLGTADSSRNAPKNQPELVGITGRNRILIVEDDRRIARALALRLENAGQEVIQAFDAVSGMEAAVQHEPDLILMDINLPGGSGLMVAQKIQSAVPQLPIIFLTASQQPGLRQQALALGAAGFLEKPYKPQELLTTIQNALLAAGDKAPRSRTSAPTTDEKPLDLRLANLGMVDSFSNAPENQPERVDIAKRNKIMLVENDRKIARDLTLLLQNAGHEVIPASDAMSGVKAAIQHQPDLILIDINLPGGSGLMVARKIQSLVPKLTPIVFLTAGQQPGLRQKALALGAAGFLEIPCKLQELLTTIQNALSLGLGNDLGTQSDCPL